MNEFVISPFQGRQMPKSLERLERLEILEPLQPAALSATDSFIDETVVRQMILDGSPDDLPRTGNPALPSISSQEAFHRHPLAFAG